MYEWEIKQNETSLHFVYNEAIGLLHCNEKSDVLQRPASDMLSVLLNQHDTPVTRDDFIEINPKLYTNNTIKNGIKQLQKNQLIGEHILQVGSNKRAMYSFLIDPSNSSLLEARMRDMHVTLYGENAKTLESERHMQTIKKVGIVVGAVAASTAASYAIIKHVRHR